MVLSFHNLFFINKNDFSQEKQYIHEKHHQKVSWTYYAIMVLGMWLIAGPSTFSYEVPAMVWSDVLCGTLLIILGYFALKPYNLWAHWGLIVIGIWLFIAPMIFFVRDGAAFLGNFLIGSLVVSFALLIAKQPGIKLFEQPGPDVPPGWTYNPSSWSQRVPIIFLAWVGFFIARYMGAFQLEIINTVWDPFFGDGTRNVLTSDVSESFPVSDATLGAFSYVLDVLFGYAGGINRWRTMPWVVIIFGILIIPLGVVSITLIILQPSVVGFWCTLCLMSAFISLLMIPFTLDEVLATVQMILYERKKGKPFWSLFWFGGTMEGGEHKEAEKANNLIGDSMKSMWKDLIQRPWNLFIVGAIGTWLMAAPEALGFSGPMADSHTITGSLIITFAIISMSDIARKLRFINILFGVWLVAAPWILGAGQEVTMWNSVISGLILIPLAFHKGKITDNRGSFDVYIK